MRINNVGYNYFHNADFRVERPSGSDDFLLVLLKSPAVFVLDGKEVAAEANSFILFDKATPQSYRANGMQFLNDWIHFDMSDSETKRFGRLGIPFDRIIQLEDINDISLIIKFMCYENYSTNLYRDRSTIFYLRLLFFKLSEKIRSANEHNSAIYHDKLSVIRSKIYNMPYHKWSVGKLAELSSMSVSRFGHTYKQVFRISVIGDIIKSRIEYAKGLLSTTDIPITKIAEMSGYNSAPHFIRQFKAHAGMTPVEYRKKSRDKIQW